MSVFSFAGATRDAMPAKAAHTIVTAPIDQIVAKKEVYRLTKYYLTVNGTAYNVSRDTYIAFMVKVGIPETSTVSP